MKKMLMTVMLALFALGITAFTSNAQAKPYLTLEFEAPTAVPFTCTNYDVRCFCPVVNCVFDDGSVTNLVNTTYINEGTEEKPIMVGQCDYGFGFVPDDDPAKTNKFVIEAGKHTVVVWGQPWSCASNTTPVTATIEITPPIETDNAFGTEYNPFALPTTMPHWISDLCWHDRWVNSYGPTYQFVVGMRDIRYGTLGPKGGIKGFTKQANWFLGTNTYYTTTDVWDENSVDHVREEKFSRGDHGFVKDTVMMKMSAEAEEALGKMPAGFSEDKVGLILQSAVCAVALPHEAHTVVDPLGTIEFGECNETFYSNFVFSVGGMAHTSSSSSWQAGQRINGEGYKDFLYGGDDGFGEHIAKFTSDRFTKNWETVNRTWIRFDDHYGKGLRSAIALLDEIPNDWKGTYRLAAKDDEQAIAAGTDWPVFDEDVYLDRGDIQMMKFSCHALNAVSKMLRAYYLTGDNETELKQLEDLQRELFAIQAERNHDTWGFSSRIEHTIYNFFRMTPTMLSKIEDTEARDDASAAFKEAVRCYLNADAFIFGRWPSPTGDNFGGARDNNKLHLIELFEDEEGAEWNAAGWRMIAENAWNSMSTQKAATIDLVKLGQQLHIKSGDTLINFGGLGEKGDGAVALSFYDFFQGNLVHGVFKDDSAGIGLVTNGYTTATSDKIVYQTGDLLVKTNWTERLSLTVNGNTVDKNLGGIYGESLIGDLARMANRYPADSTNRFLRGFASRFAEITTCEREVVKDTKVLEEGFTYKADPATENGGAFKVNAGAKLTGANVTFLANEANFGGAICNAGMLSLDGVTFEGNKATSAGGAIYNEGTINLDGAVTLVTASDTLKNSSPGTLNWNLAGDRSGVLNGYEKLNNHSTLQLTVEDYAAMSTNFVIATGDFSDVKGKDTFAIRNGKDMGFITINGAAVEVGDSSYELITVNDQLCLTARRVRVYGLTENVGDYTWIFSIINGEAEIGVRDQHGTPQSQKAILPDPMGSIALPSVLGGCPVVGLGYYALANSSGMISLVVPSSVTSFGPYALSSCSNLNAIDFEGAPPEGVPDAGIRQDAAIRYNAVYETAWLPVIEQCGWTNAKPYDPHHPIVAGVSAQQRYPWNGKVDISYTVDNAGKESREVSVWAVDQTTGVTNIAKSVTGETAYTSGNHKIVWDMAADGLTLVSTGVVFVVSYKEPLYCVIDISGGTSVQGESDPVRVDLTTGTRTAAVTEILTYSTEWDEVEKAGGGGERMSVVAVDSKVISEASGSGTIRWTPLLPGMEHTLTHTVLVGGKPVGEPLTATFRVSGEERGFAVSFVAPNGESSMERAYFATNRPYGRLPLARREGCTFAGWYTSLDGTERVGAFDQVLPDVKTLYARWAEDEAPLYAQWDPNHYSAVFNPDGGTGEMADQPFIYDQRQALTANAFKKTGYTFKGWATNEAGEVVYVDKQIVSNLTAEAGFAVALFAKWEQIMDITEVEIEEWVVYDLAQTYHKPSEKPIEYVKRFKARFGDDYTKAFYAETGKIGQDGTALCVYHDYIAGTDPLDKDSQFTASITFDESGKPVVTYDPVLSEAKTAQRIYTTYGKANLQDKDWSVVQPGQEADHRFFKVTIEMRPKN